MSGCRQRKSARHWPAHGKDRRERQDLDAE